MRWYELNQVFLNDREAMAGPAAPSRRHRNGVVRDEQDNAYSLSIRARPQSRHGQRWRMIGV